MMGSSTEIPSSEKRRLVQAAAGILGNLSSLWGGGIFVILPESIKDNQAEVCFLIKVEFFKFVESRDYKGEGFVQEKYSFKEIEPKWQKQWVEGKAYKTEKNSRKPKYYALARAATRLARRLFLRAAAFL